MATRVGVRELRQNLSVYLRRVETGEVFEVTERGRPVATLGPREDKVDDPVDRLIRRLGGRRGSGDLLDVEPAPRNGTDSLSQALQDQREDRL